MDHDARNIGLCMIVPLVALAVAMPFAEGGFVDDFSYIHMAKTLAETGRFAYNGWPTAMLGIQVWWGAAWIWLCGFSFTVVRLGVLPFALGAVAMVYLLARRARLSPSDSLFAALLTGLSTLFLPLAATFMSDIPAFACLNVALYGFARAADAAEEVPARETRAVAWLAFGTIVAVLGGTIRQTVWFVPVACAAVLCLRRSCGTRLRLAALASLAVGLATIVVGTSWFNRQPYAIPTRLPAVGSLAPSDMAAVVRDALSVVAESFQKVLPALLFCLPWVMTRAVDAMRTGWGRAVVVVTVGAMAIVVTGTVAGSFEGPLVLLGGWWRPVGHPLYDTGVGLVRCGVLGLGVALALAVTVAVARRRADPGPVPRLPAAIVMPLAYLVPYGLSLLLVSRTTAGIYPRYYLPMLPVLTCWLLVSTRPSARARVGADRRSSLGWLLMAFFAARGIAIAHDEFVDTRARLAAIAFLERQGVARDRITSKWAIDGWEQIERQGHVNDPRIRNPPDAYREDLPHDYPDPQFRDRFPALRPEYIVAEEREQMPGDTRAFPRFPYTAWLRRPHFREIVIRAQASGNEAGEVAAGDSLRPVSR